MYCVLYVISARRTSRLRNIFAFDFEYRIFSFDYFGHVLVELLQYNITVINNQLRAVYRPFSDNCLFFNARHSYAYQSSSSDGMRIIDEFRYDQKKKPLVLYNEICVMCVGRPSRVHRVSAMLFLLIFVL